MQVISFKAWSNTLYLLTCLSIQRITQFLFEYLYLRGFWVLSETDFVGNISALLDCLYWLALWLLLRLLGRLRSHRTLSLPWVSSGTSLFALSLRTGRIQRLWNQLLLRFLDRLEEFGVLLQQVRVDLWRCEAVLQLHNLEFASLGVQDLRLNAGWWQLRNACFLYHWCDCRHVLLEIKRVLSQKLWLDFLAIFH